jgi:hypothetical protein
MRYSKNRIDVVSTLRNMVAEAVAAAMHSMAAGGRTVVPAGAGPAPRQVVQVQGTPTFRRRKTRSDAGKPRYTMSAVAMPQSLSTVRPSAKYRAAQLPERNADGKTVQPVAPVPQQPAPRRSSGKRAERTPRTYTAEQTAAYQARQANRMQAVEWVEQQLHAYPDPALPNFCYRVGREKQDGSGKVVEKTYWIWAEFPDKPDRAWIEFLKSVGFHWNKFRKVWQHPCGHPSRRADDDPRLRYSVDDI